MSIPGYRLRDSVAKRKLSGFFVDQGGNGVEFPTSFWVARAAFPRLTNMLRFGTVAVVTRGKRRI
jgi:hypothetical protein